ncbi:hypothetical protein BDR26DRAFT_1005611 [Obelidium mucronatum]|nr:hypothetical protein BDR26DRAFT_1005611 [Obelidium mucronatum]
MPILTPPTQRPPNNDAQRAAKAATYLKTREVLHMLSPGELIHSCVILNGSNEIHGLVDTAATVSILDDNCAKAMGIKVSRTIRVTIEGWDSKPSLRTVAVSEPITFATADGHTTTKSIMISSNPREKLTIGLDIFHDLGLYIGKLQHIGLRPTPEDFDEDPVPAISFPPSSLSKEDHEEREKFLEAIQPFLAENHAIPPTARAKLPTHFTIELVDGATPKFISQYKLPFHKRPIVEAKIKDWENRGRQRASSTE